MPFAVFRRNQRVMMAALALFAMVAFTLDFSLLRFGGGPGDDYVRDASGEPIRLYNRTIRQSDLNPMIAERSRANRFMMLLGAQSQDFFGEMSTPALVDALILQNEADRLGMPVDKNLAVAWLKERGLTTSRFNEIYQQHFSREVTDVQLLEEIANQIRLAQVQALPGLPLLTPFDLFQAYRDQNRRVSGQLVPFRVEEFLAEVPQPSPSQVSEYFEKYKDVEPDPSRDTPGFKIPRRIVVEYVMADLGDLAEVIRAGLTDEEIRAHYAQFPDRFPSSKPELPESIFAGEPELTPRLTDPFAAVRDQVARDLARSRAEERTAEQFNNVKEALDRFAFDYLDAKDRAEQRREKNPQLPQPGDVMKSAAEAEGLEFERTPPIERSLAENYGRIGTATIGGGPFEPGISFAEEFFDSTREPFEWVELADPREDRVFLAWKVADEPARVPTLEEVRDQVVLAWRMEQARAKAEEAAKRFVAAVEAAGGNLDQVAQAESRTVVPTSPTTRIAQGFGDPSGMMLIPSRPNTLPEVPDAGEAFLKTYFELEPGQLAVAPNAPKTVYYVVRVNDATPVEIAGLYDAFRGSRVGIQNELLAESYGQLNQAWMNELRARAGLPPDWAPREERSRSRRGA